MFFGWLKGLFASFLIWIGLTLIVYGLYLIGDDRSGTVPLLIGIVASVIGSYFKYVSKQTIKSVKK
jgi:predicted tellurium resistance membrane protein TerC